MLSVRSGQSSFLFKFNLVNREGQWHNSSLVKIQPSQVCFWDLTIIINYSENQKMSGIRGTWDTHGMTLSLPSGGSWHVRAACQLPADWEQKPFLLAPWPASIQGPRICWAPMAHLDLQAIPECTHLLVKFRNDLSKEPLVQSQQAVKFRFVKYSRFIKKFLPY